MADSDRIVKCEQKIMNKVGTVRELLFTLLRFVNAVNVNTCIRQNKSNINTVRIGL